MMMVEEPVATTDVVQNNETTDNTTTIDEETLQQQMENPETGHFTSDVFDPACIGYKSGAKVEWTKAKKNNPSVGLMKLFNVRNNSGALHVELQTPMKAMFPYDPKKNSLALILRSQDHKHQSFLDQFDVRGRELGLASNPYGWSADDIEFIKWHKSPERQLKLKIPITKTKFYLIKDMETGEIEETDVSVLGSKEDPNDPDDFYYPIFRPAYLWFTNDNCGMSKESSGICVLRRSMFNPFDFILDEKEGGKRTTFTNRLSSEVDLENELVFYKKLHTNKHGTTSLYMHMDDWQMPRAKIPFDYKPNVDEDTGETVGTGSLQFNIDGSSKPFLERLDAVTLQNFYEKYPTWYSSHPRNCKGPEYFRDKNIFRSSIYTPKGDYPEQYSVKVFETGGKSETKVWVYNNKTGQYDPGSQNDLKRGAEAVPIITLTKLNFKGSNERCTRAGFSFTLRRVLVFPNGDNQQISGFKLFKRKNFAGNSAPPPPTKRAKDSDDESNAEGEDQFVKKYTEEVDYNDIM